VSAKQIAADNKTVFIRFMIDDTGKGLTDKMKESIFGFSQGTEDGVVEEQHFDLSLASRIIQLMGGQIGVDNRGAGTHLYFTIPFELQDDAKENKPSKRKTNKSVGDFTGKRILIAEDSDMAQDALRAVLEVVGFEVDAAENGKKAVIAFELMENKYKSEYEKRPDVYKKFCERAAFLIEMSGNNGTRYFKNAYKTRRSFSGLIKYILAKLRLYRPLNNLVSRFM
jgi:hypothetical protein